MQAITETAFLHAEASAIWSAFSNALCGPVVNRVAGYMLLPHFG